MKLNDGSLANRALSQTLSKASEISRVTTKESGFVSRRASYRSIRTKQRGKLELQKFLEKFFGKEPESFFSRRLSQTFNLLYANKSLGLTSLSFTLYLSRNKSIMAKRRMRRLV